MVEWWRMVEVERKYRIRSVAAFRRRLAGAGVLKPRVTHQVDTYYSPPHQTFLGRPRYLRVRETVLGRTVGARLEYHVPFARYAAHEYELPVQDGVLLRSILQHLGFVRELVVRKERESWKRRGVKIELDRVQGLGSFVELEVMGLSQRQALKRIDALARELGFTVADRAEGMNYFTMLLQKQRPAAYRTYYGSR